MSWKLFLQRWRRLFPARRQRSADKPLFRRVNLDVERLESRWLPTSVKFQAGSFSVNDTAGNATINVSLDTMSSQTITVHYATSNGTATAGKDYTSASGTLTIPANTFGGSFLVSRAIMLAACGSERRSEIPSPGSIEGG